MAVVRALNATSVSAMLCGTLYANAKTLLFTQLPVIMVNITSGVVFISFSDRFKFLVARAVVLAFVCAVMGTGSRFAAAQQTPPAAPPKAAVPDVQSVEVKGLEVSEQLSESLANQLLDLSVAVHDLNREQTAPFFAKSMTAAPFPSQPGAPKTDIKWISTHSWTAPANGAGTSLSRQEFLDAFFAFLSHFSSIKEVRFKLKLASFDDASKADLASEVPTAIPGAAGHGRVFFYVVGRDPQQKREWARGTMEADVRYNVKDHWEIIGFKLTAFDSTVADTDIFSEVSVPAGTSINKPAFGTPGSDGFIYRGAVAAD